MQVPTNTIKPFIKWISVESEMSLLPLRKCHIISTTKVSQLKSVQKTVKLRPQICFHNTSPQYLVITFAWKLMNRQKSFDEMYIQFPSIQTFHFITVIHSFRFSQILCSFFLHACMCLRVWGIHVLFLEDIYIYLEY